MPGELGVPLPLPVLSPYPVRLLISKLSSTRQIEEDEDETAMGTVDYTTGLRGPRTPDPYRHPTQASSIKSFIKS